MKFKINGKEYEGAKYDFNTYCTMAEMGVDIGDMFSKPYLACRAYLAVSGGMTVEQAGDEIEEHLINDGELSGLSDALAKELESSGFFMKMMEKLKKQAEAAQKKKKVKKDKETLKEGEESTNP